MPGTIHPDAPLRIDFAPGTSLLQETERVSQLPILGNGPVGTFVIFPDGLRVSLPTDQIVGMDDAGGRARVAFGGMHFVECRDGVLRFHRVRELHPLDRLSPDRSHVMTLKTAWVATVLADGRAVWPD